jgi:threonine/homoserine/homoserine lactone efflux protein
MLEFVTGGAGFGFTAGTSIGALHTLLMNITLTKGWRQGIWIAFSPLISDLPIVILMLFLLKQLPPVGIEAIRIAGGLVILFMAWRGWVAYRKNEPITVTQEAVVGETRQTILKGMLFNLLNPGPYIFWGTVLGPTLIRAMEISALHAVGFVIAFYGTFIGIMLGFVVLFERARTLPPGVVRMLSLLSVIVLGILGIVLIISGINGVTALA